MGNVEENGLREVDFRAFLVSFVIRLLCIYWTGMAECFLRTNDSLSCGFASELEEIVYNA